MRTALFVDFDNIYISFAELDETAARRFATQPARWLAWFESGAHAATDEEAAPEPRRILFRRCYLNPVTFGRYRGDYTRAAFTVVDCPPLTQRGKTSADVYMVMDMLDALSHPTRFDEFVILSSDADFTPVLLRLRAHDRRTTILATNVAAAAYKAACDNIVPYERFFEEALGIEAEPSTLPELMQEPDRAALLPRAAQALRDHLAADGPLTAREVPSVFATFPEFRNSSWFGCFSLKALMARLLQLEPSLVMQGDPNALWTVTLREGAPPQQRIVKSDVDLVGRVVDEVRGMLAHATQPIPMATAASRINREMGTAVRESQWDGYGTFKALLLAQRAPDIAILEMQPGYIYDPSRHDVARIGQTEGELDANLPGDLVAFVRRIAGITGAPALSPKHYAILFQAIAEAAVGDDTNLNQLSAAVRDLCQARGTLVSRAQISFVLTGFRYHQIDLAGCTAAELAREWRRNVRELCANAQLELSADEEKLLDRWIPDELPPSEAGDAGSVPDDASSDADLDMQPQEPDPTPAS